jgi:hypothetical protein
MPVGLAQTPQVDLDSLEQNAAYLPVPQGLRYGVEAGVGDMTTRALQAVKQPVIEAGQQLGFDASDMFGMATPLTSDQANEQYGVPGYLRFNEATTQDDAAFRSAQAHEKLFRDNVLALTKPNPLADFGAGITGSLLDPVGLGVMVGTGGLGDLALGAYDGARVAGSVGAAVAKLGRLGNIAGQGVRALTIGALDNAPYVGFSAALSQYAGDDYSFGDGLRDIAAGAILHTGMHFLGQGVESLSRMAERKPQPLTPPPSDAYVPPAGVPDPVRDLPPEARQGAFTLALDSAIDDRSVDVGQYVDREANPPGVGRLDETTADPAMASFRPLADDTAVTPRGTDIPVRYGLAELGDLVTSHDDDLQPNPNFPPELQPRDRARAGAQARNHQLEAELNPKLLMNDVGAGAGAPIVAPDGVVESGNGRTIALRRSANRGGAAYERYKAELARQGFDTAGLKQPVLVRMRTEAMQGAQRAALAREMNADVTERMSATEQAMSDAARMPDALFDHVRDNQGPTTSRDFARAFIDRVAPGDQNTLAAADGTLSPEGARRIKAAVLARAYGDPRLVAQAFEDEAAPVRQHAEALAEAAPGWARMRAAAARGDIPAALDITDALRSAMDLVRHAKAEGIGLDQLLAERLGQRELFGGEAIGPTTEALLRLMYRDEAFKKPLAAAKLASALKDYARQALGVKPGPDLFGAVADENTSRQILAGVAARFARGDAGPLDVRPPGRAAEPRAARDPVIDLREPGGERDGGGRGLSPQNGGGAEGAGGGGGGEPGRQTGDSIIAADPELKALSEDTAAFAAAHGVDEPAEDRDNPNTIAEAVRAAAVCMLGEGEI